MPFTGPPGKDKEGILSVAVRAEAGRRAEN